MAVRTATSVAKRGFEYYQGTSVEKLIAESLQEYLEVVITFNAGGSVEGIFKGVKLTPKVSLHVPPPPTHSRTAGGCHPAQRGEHGY